VCLQDGGSVMSERGPWVYPPKDLGRPHGHTARAITASVVCWELLYDCAA